jgi:hypothetical protein
MSAPPDPSRPSFALRPKTPKEGAGVDDYTRWTITTLPPITMELVFIDLREESLLICSESSADNKPLVVSNS